MNLKIKLKTFSFALNKTLTTSQGKLNEKKGWLIKIEDDNNRIGWGEVAPVNNEEIAQCETILTRITSHIQKQEIEQKLIYWPKSLRFGFGAALAEIDCIIGSDSKDGWLKAPKSAFLLDSQDSIIEQVSYLAGEFQAKNEILTLKLKVGLKSNNQEEKIVEKLLKLLPSNSRLRLDVNGGWEFNQAKAWASKLKDEPRLEWIEQPLPTEDIDGLMKLSKLIPIALDESLIHNPDLIKTWKGWQVRRPLLEGDPRLLLEELVNGTKFRMISTSFETGIGRRWIEHLAALQNKGPTPTAPGLAPGWSPKTNLFSSKPEIVWKAA